MERRRRWVASGCLPPVIAAQFTTAEVAALAVISAETRKKGDCRLTIKEIADVAGVSPTTVKNALRAARALNILLIEERRLTAFRNAPNVVRIISPEWRAWLGLGGGKSVPRSPTQTKKEALAQRDRAWFAEEQTPFSYNGNAQSASIPIQTPPTASDTSRLERRRVRWGLGHPVPHKNL